MDEYIKRSEVVGLVEDKLRRCETVLEALAFASLRTKVMGLRSADVAPRSEWISVEERLPERMKPVLVLATSRYEEDGYDVLIAYHDGGEWEEQCVHSHECCVFYIYADVKFWMPLPEPPKGDHHE